MEYSIIHKTKKFVFASGFSSLEKARAYREKFNPNIWDDKTMTKDDLVIMDKSGAVYE